MADTEKSSQLRWVLKKWELENAAIGFLPYGLYSHLRKAKKQAMTFHGVNHLALVSGNMDRTVRFYTQVLGLRLVRTQRNDDDQNSRHYFFELGGGNLLAFFDFPRYPHGHVGTGTMHHVAFSVENITQLEELRQHLRSQAVEVSPIVDHDFIQSIYFHDPDGILLEASVYTRSLTEADVWVDPDPVPSVAELRRGRQ